MTVKYYRSTCDAVECHKEILDELYEERLIKLQFENRI
jgi:hypothetical protein